MFEIIARLAPAQSVTVTDTHVVVRYSAGLGYGVINFRTGTCADVLTARDAANVIALLSE